MRVFMSVAFPWMVFVAMTSIAAMAQTSGVTADLAGTVFDQTGAVLPGVMITVTGNSTGLTRTVVSEEKGLFLVQNLPSGTYTVKAEFSGFTTVTLTSVTVTLGQRVNLPIRMSVGSVAETVTVTEESTPVVETSKTEVSSLVNERAINDMPINIRNPLQFILTTPGTTTQRTTTGSNYSFGGGRARNNSSNIDGVDNNDDAIRGFMAQPSLDAVKEFQVLASNYSAEFGRASGGVVNTILKSGTNDINGSAFYYIRDRAFAANNFFVNANQANPPNFKPYFRQQQFGGALGGPIKKNKLFLFGSYEHFRTNAFSVVTISQANTDTINNVLAGNYASVPGLGPNFPRGIKLGYTKIGGPGSFLRTQRRHITVEKLDWQPTANDSFYFRHLFNRNENGTPGSALNDNTRNANDFKGDTSSYVGSYTRIISTHTLNELRYQYAPSTSGDIVDDPIGPGINISGVANIGRNLNQPQGRSQRRSQLLDNVSWQTGKHQVKFGADINRVRRISSLPGTNAGNLGGLGGVFTFANLAAFLDGNATNFFQGFGASGTNQLSWNYGFFVQDNFLIHRSLTLNAGVRYELQTNPEVNNILDPTPREVNRDSNNFGPRIGLAYSPGSSGKTVIRAGYGIYYDLLFGNITGNLGQFNGLTVKTLTLVGADAAARFRGQNFGFPAGAFPNVPPPSGLGNHVWTSPSPIPDASFPPQAITTADPDLPTAYSQQAQLTVERQVAPDLSISTIYMLNRGVKYPALRNVNLPAPIIINGRPTYNINARASELPDQRISINNRFEPNGSSTYHALAVSAVKRFSRNTQFNASWTYSHAIDFIPDAIFDNPFTQNQLNMRDDRGNSLQDQRHRFLFSGVFVLPKNESLLGKVFGNFSLAPIATLGTGVFYNITTGTDSNGDGQTGTDRPLGVGRNTFRGDSTLNYDLRVSRNIGVGENRKIQVIAEGFNIFNTTNFSNYNTVWGTGAYPSTPNATFGTPTASGASLGGGGIIDVPARVIQFGIRYSF